MFSFLVLSSFTWNKNTSNSWTCVKYRDSVNISQDAPSKITHKNLYAKRRITD